MYIRKDIHKSLRLEAKMAEGSKCFSWSKLFRECSYLLRQKDREIERLRAALAEAADNLDDWGGYVNANKARAALEDRT
jgi:hypothetical protein